ncbi:unnamed protein product, partial [Symbiodinium sp. CCMP2456]
MGPSAPGLGSDGWLPEAWSGLEDDESQGESRGATWVRGAADAKAIKDFSSTELPGANLSSQCASHGIAGTEELELADADGIPADMWVEWAAGCQRWRDFCRGGGGGQGHSELLDGLQALLAKIPKQTTGQSVAKNKGKGKRTDGGACGTDPPPGGQSRKGKGQGNKISNDDELVAALESLVRNARKDATNLLEDLQMLVAKAVAGYGQGRAARRAEAQGDEWTTVVNKRQRGPTPQWVIDPLVGGIIGVGVARTRLANGQELKAAIIVANEMQELSALQSLARAHELKDKVAVVCKFEPPAGATTMQLPSIGPKGQRQVRAWPVVALCAAGKPEIKHNVVIRQVPAFFGIWHKMQAGEQHQREAVLECYAKVIADQKAAILAKSGTNGVFVMELARDGAKRYVEWQPTEDLSGQAYLQATLRKAQTVGTSLAYRRGGGASLGVRIAPDKVGDRVCAWRARKVISPGRGNLPWLVRGRLKGDAGQPVLAIQVGKHTVDLERATAKRKLVDLEAARLQPEKPQRGAGLSSGPSLSKGGNKGQNSSARGKGQAARAAAVSGEAAQQGKEGASDTGGRDRSRSPTRTADAWHEVLECGGSGSCFYNAIGAYFAVQRDGFNVPDAKKLAKARGATLRAEIAGYIREKAGTFKDFWVSPEIPADEAGRVNLEQMEGGTPPGSWEDYLKALDRPTRWADDIAFRAAVKRLNCRIIVAVDDAENPTQLLAYGKQIDFKDGRKQAVIPLLYSEKHYQLIMAKPGKDIADSWRTLPVGGHATVPRGGGDGEWLPPRSPSSAASSSAAPPSRRVGGGVRLEHERTNDPPQLEERQWRLAPTSSSVVVGSLGSCITGRVMDTTDPGFAGIIVDSSYSG